MPFDSSGLKVCFLAGTLGRGGAERQLLYMLRALSQAGISSRVLCLTRGESFEPEIRALGVPVEWVGESSSRPVRLYRIIQALRREKPDILQSVHFYTNLYAAVSSRIVGIPDIGAIRCDVQSEVKESGITGRLHLTLPRHLIANSDSARHSAIARGIPPDRIDFVRNAVDTANSNGKQSLDEHQAMRVLFVGRLTEQKRPDRFLRVMAKVTQQIPGRLVKARIAGDGPMRPRLEALAASLGLKPNGLEFLGERADMNAVYRDADLVVMTSEWEGTPNSLLEAMACRVPIAATRVGGVPEILAEDRGLLVEPDDEDGLTAAILRLIADSSLRKQLSGRGHDYAARFHSLEVLGNQLAGVYGKILSQ